MDTLMDKFPSCIPFLAEFKRLRAEVVRVPLPRFFEPKVALVTKGGAPPELLALDAVSLSSWASHIACGARARMHALEDAVCRLLDLQEVVPAMALVRAHLETSGFAAFGAGSVRKCADTGNWEEMKRIIPRTLFGTSLKLEKKARAIRETILPSDLEPVRIAAMVDAMDQFAEQNVTPVAHWFRGAYSILCEYAHPTIRGMKPFCEILNDAGDGWHLQYRFSQSLTEGEAVMAISILTESMRVGHGSALLLQSWQFQDGSEGISCCKTPVEFGDWVWEAILQRPSDLTIPDYAYDA
jgi:hypothetical protein